MKFGKLLDSQVQDGWQQHYLDYRALKHALEEAQDDDAPIVESPRTTSLSVARHMVGSEGRDGTSAGKERFMVKLQMEMAKVTAFAQATAAALRQELMTLLQHSTGMYTPRLTELQSAAHALGDSVLALERFIQLNQVGFMKIIKKHDKAFPATPLRSFFTQYLANHPWARDAQPSLWALVSAIFQQLHTAPFQGDPASGHRGSSEGTAPLPLLGAAAAAAGGAHASTAAPDVGVAAKRRSPRASRDAGRNASELLAADARPVSYKYWVRQEDVSQVMYAILQHLPMVPSSAVPMEQEQQRQRADPEAPQADVVLDTTLGGGAKGGATAASDAGWHQDSARHRRRGTFDDCSTTERTVYLDNDVLELYHNRLYVRPDAATIKLVWKADGEGMPKLLMLQRKVHRQGWKGDPNTKDTIMLRSDKVSGFMDGSYTLWQALQHMLPPATITSPLGMHASEQSTGAAQHGPKQQQEDEPQQAAAGDANVPGPSGGGSIWDQSFEDLAQLPTCTKQLSLFSELQGFIARKRLRPVLSTAARRLAFQMPFDPALRIMLETDVLMTSQVWDGPLTPGDWTQLLSEQLEDAVGVYRLPYCLLKVTTSTPQVAAWPAWLQALVTGERVSEVEDWSKFVHGCAILMLEQARAVPYWVDDPLIAASSRAFENEWEHLIDEEEEAAGLGLRKQASGQHGSWAHGHGHIDSSGDDQGRDDGQRRVTAERGASLPHKHPGARVGIAEDKGRAESMPALARLQSHASASSSGGPAARVVSLGLAGRFIARALSMRSSQQAAGSSSSQPGGRDVPDEFLAQLKKRRRGRRRHGHPAQLLALRDFLHNEDVFMTWLGMAVMLSGSALLLLSFSAMAKMNPMSHPEIHIAEVIMLMLLPVSVVMVGYAMVLYLWRSRRLYHPMRYWRVDDSWGPNLMAIVIVIMLWAILVVSITDMAILIRKERKHHIDPLPDPSPLPSPALLLW